MQEQPKRRTVKTITGRIRYATETGVKVDGFPYWVNLPRHDFEGQLLPKRDQVWKLTFEMYPRMEGDLACFMREMEYLETVPPEPSPPSSSDDDGQPMLFERPSYEDGEWYWRIKDERGDISRKTYDQYLLSEAWSRVREKRLGVDRHLCRAQLPGCTVAATQCHHLTHSHLGCEPQWELRSVCGSCHALLTAMDKRQRSFSRDVNQ